MAVTREELQRRLALFEHLLPELIQQFPDAEHFNPACSELADDITDHAGPEDEQWAFEQIDKVLEKHGLWRPGQADLPPDE